MPKYLGKGANFYLVTCDLVPSPNISLEEKKNYHQEVCSKCGLYKDAVNRKEKAERQGKAWRRLICIHPKNTDALKKFKPHVTVWGK